MNVMIDRFGWTLLNSIWEGAVLWAGLRLALLFLAPASASTRYVVSCLALVLAITAPAVTYLEVAPRKAEAASVTSAAPIVPGSGPALMPGGSQAMTPAPERVAGNGVWLASITDTLVPFLPALVLLWLMGFGYSLAQHAVHWGRVGRLLRRPLKPLSGSLERTAADLRRRIGLRRAVRIGESALVQVPSVVGWLKPVVLLPMGALSGLTSKEVEGLIAHELAHIVRHDFPINAIQGACEAFFFYHPAIRAINRIIRIERENACDDVAVDLMGDARSYATALARLEEARRPALVLAAAGEGGLLVRIRRILAPIPAGGSWSVGSAGVAVTGAALYLIMLCVLPNLCARAADASGAAASSGVSTAGETLYRLGMGDVLRLMIFDGPRRMSDLESVVRCDIEGNVTLPGIGPVHVGGMTLREADRTLAEVYRKSVFALERPNVTLSVEDYASREIIIAGQVRNPGRFLLPNEGIATPVDEVTRAGGVTDVGDGHAVRIISHVGGQSRVSVVDVEGFIEGTASDPAAGAMPLQAGDIIFVPRRHEGISEDPDSLPEKPIPQLTFEIKPAVSRVRFRQGDRIEITSIRCDRTKIEPGCTLLVSGTYRLESASEASLALNLTTMARVGTRVFPDQNVEVTRGSGHFSLRGVMAYPGQFQLAFYYPAADGGYYFGSPPGSGDQTQGGLYFSDLE